MEKLFKVFFFASIFNLFLFNRHAVAVDEELPKRMDLLGFFSRVIELPFVTFEHISVRSVEGVEKVGTLFIDKNGALFEKGVGGLVEIGKVVVDKASDSIQVMANKGNEAIKTIMENPESIARLTELARAVHPAGGAVDPVATNAVKLVPLFIHQQ